MKTFFLMLLLALISYGQIDKLDKFLNSKLENNTRSNVLFKNSATQAVYSYRSTYFNVNYTCPSGWSITSVDTTPDTYFLTVQRPAYYDILVFGSRCETSREAKFFNYSSNYASIKVCYNGSQGKMPGVYDIFDTTYATSNITMVRSKIKYYKTSTTSYTDIGVTYTENLGIFQHGILYMVPITEYTNYDTSYTKSWFNLLFADYKNIGIERTVLAKTSSNIMTTANGIATLTLADQQQVKLDLYNIQGRKLAKIFDGELQGTNSFDINQYFPSNQTYFLLMKTNNKIEASKLTRIK